MRLTSADRLAFRAFRAFPAFPAFRAFPAFLAFLVFLALAALAPAIAHGYPQFQLSTGNDSCGACHWSPTGGGLLTPFGRDESADTISRGGDGAFLYGAYEEPAWIKLGVDLRVAGLVKHQAADVEYHAFPMLGDTYAFLMRGAWSVYAALGPRAQTRAGRRPFLERFGSREHYVMWRPSTAGLYARAGRFHAPFGLRSQDHTLYVRRELNLYAFDETYNLSAGHIGDTDELHVTAFTDLGTRFTQAGSAGESGAALLYERRVLDDTAAIAGQARVALSDRGATYTVGAVGKYFLERAGVIVLGELDITLETFADDAGPARARLTSYLGASWFATQGVMLTAAHEHHDADLSVAGLARDALSLTVQLFPRAKWEIMLIGKLERHGANSRRGALAMLQLHYYL